MIYLCSQFHSHIPWLAVVMVWSEANDLQNYLNTVDCKKTKKNVTCSHKPF